MKYLKLTNIASSSSNPFPQVIGMGGFIAFVEPTSQYGISVRTTNKSGDVGGIFINLDQSGVAPTLADAQLMYKELNEAITSAPGASGGTLKVYTTHKIGSVTFGI